MLLRTRTVRRWDSADGPQPNTHQIDCQTSDTIVLPLRADPVEKRRSAAAAGGRKSRMLRFLSITNLAIIDRLELEFAPGLNVLTGETGAGKSILVGAVGLLVGGRASAELVRTGEETATVQAVFEQPDGRELIVRREVSSQGRSRAFLDGAIVTGAALRDTAGFLVDL